MVLLLSASVADVRSRKIPNLLCAAGWLAGLGWQYLASGMQGVLHWAGGAAVAFLAGFGIYLIGAVGAGDVKLLSVTGGFLGERAVLYVGIASLVLGAVVSLFFRIREKGDRIPFAPCIFGATLLWLWKGG